jgi:hypothetical protein
MSSSAAHPRLNAIAFWDRFHRQADLRVRQFSRAAGKPLLVTRSSGPFVHRLSVEFAGRPAYRIECSFDLDRKMLHCRPGPALEPNEFQFQWIPEAGGILQMNGGNFTLDAAIDLVLNRLTAGT